MSKRERFLLARVSRRLDEWPTFSDIITAVHDERETMNESDLNLDLPKVIDILLQRHSSMTYEVRLV